MNSLLNKFLPMNNRYVFFIFLFFISSYLPAQQFGGHPPKHKWRQLSTDTVRIIYPAGLDSQAQRVAAIVHELAAKNISLGNKMEKVNIVLQNQTTVANGYVSLGPYRSEFYMTPSPNSFSLGSISWADQLAVHEYRHVQQFNNFKTGASKVMYYLFGEEGLGLAINAAVPDWFYEGDAVYNETVHTEQGRGRLPHFINEYKSLWQDNKKYSWMKLRNGSLKDYIPSHYHLGFLLVNYGYEKYGADFWKKVTLDAAAFKGLIYPFQKAIKKYAGVDYKTFKKDAFTFYKGPLQTSPNGGGLRESELNSDMQYKSARPDEPFGRATQEKLNQGTEAGQQKITTPNLNHVTNYYFPVQLSADSLLYVKSSYRRRSSFMVKQGGREHLLRVRDISFDEQYSAKNGQLVYAAYKADPRWGWHDYSEIKLLDIATGRQRTVTQRSKYFSPDISADGSKIVAVQNAADGSSELHILEAISGAVIQRFSSAEVSLFADPKFADDEKIVFAARLSDGRMSLMMVNSNNGKMEKLTPPSFSVIGFTHVNNGYIYYTASYFGNDELYAFHLDSRKIYKVTSSPLGNYFVSADKDSLLFSSFSAEGYQLKKMSTGNMKFNEMNALSLQLPPPPVPVALADAYRNRQLSAIAGRNFPSTQYHKGTRLFNFHSWRPYYEDPEFSFSLYGENVLNTFQSELYYLYNQNDRTNAVGFNAVYGGLFPYLSFGSQITFDRSDTTNGKNRKWNQVDSRIGLNIPLNFSGGRFYRYLNFGSSLVVRNEVNTGPNKTLYPENDFTYLSHLLSYSQQVERARQHIFPRFGYGFTLQQRHAITNYKGYQFMGSGSLYLPGFLSTHHLVLNGSFQQRDTLRRLFSNRFTYSRGYHEFYFSRMWRMSANYHLPLWLPDWGFGNLLYIHRIRANGFYDFTKVYSRNKQVTVDQRSAGLEIFFDTNWWNQYPLTFGFRISRLLDDDLATGKQGSLFEFILPVSIFPR